MGVYIKGMEMPKHCGYCRFRYDGICHALQKTQYAATDCPLIEVPTPHGRLIDAGELLKWADANPLTEDGGIDINDFEEYLDNAPTIIKAEEE